MTSPRVKVEATYVAERSVTTTTSSDCGGDSPQRSREEWYLTNRDFLEVIADALGLRMVYAG